VKLDQSWRDRAGYNASPSEESAAYYCRTLNGKPLASDPSGKHFTSLDTVADWSAAYELVPSIVVGYIWHASAHALEVETGLRRIGLEPVQQIIWNKERFTLSRQHYHWMHEPCFYVRRQGRPVPWYGPRDQATVWQAPSPKQIFSGSEEEKLPHPCQKPILLFKRPLENHLQRGETVYDPFLGSGTCMAAAEEVGCICYGIEIAPAYAAVILERMTRLGLCPERA
jgi:DNA modification methylase